MENQKNYSLTELGPLASLSRVTLKDILGLTGAEISANVMPAGKESAFAHSHKRNEEIYLFTSGKGFFWLDGTVYPVREGSAVRVSPAALRAIKAADTEPLSYFCIQVENGSLVQATREDGVISDVKPSW